MLNCIIYKLYYLLRGSLLKKLYPCIDAPTGVLLTSILHYSFKHQTLVLVQKLTFLKYQVFVFMLNHVGVDISYPCVKGTNHLKTNCAV